MYCEFFFYAGSWFWDTQCNTVHCLLNICVYTILTVIIITVGIDLKFTYDTSVLVFCGLTFFSVSLLYPSFPTFPHCPNETYIWVQSPGHSCEWTVLVALPASVYVTRAACGIVFLYALWNWAVKAGIMQ